MRGPDSRWIEEEVFMKKWKMRRWDEIDNAGRVALIPLEGP